MKKLLCFLAAVALLAGCKKPDLAGNTSTGEGLVPFSLKTPASASQVVLNAATPSATVDFSWNPSTPGLHTAPSYTWIAAPKATGISTPTIRYKAGDGKSTTLSLTHKQLDSLLKAAGIADGAKTDLVWSVEADNGSTKLTAQNTFSISVTRFKDGASPFSILGPSSTTAVMSMNPGSTTDSLRFNWTRSSSAPGGAAIKYRVYFYKDELNAPVLFSIQSNRSGADTVLSISYKDLSDTLTAHGFTDPSAVANLKWTVAASSGSWTQFSDFTNQLYIARLVRMYLVGSMNNWDINAPFEMIADKNGGRLRKVFYSYVKLAAGEEFKFVRTPGDWGSAYGNAGTSGSGFTTGFNQGGNFSAPSAGVYRLTIDLGANMAYMQAKQVGLVGSLQNPQWDPSAPIIGGLTQRNKFLIIANMSATDEFKFHDGPVWDNGAPDKARWWGKAATPGFLDNDGNGGNITNTTGATRIRAIWDGTDPQQVKYEMSSAAEMRIVGDGILGVNAWDPPSSPQLTYAGNGKWTITTDLVAGKEFKFVAGNAWGALDYEDQSGSSTTGTRVVRWDGGSNFKTPGSGTYTITLDEYNQTVTIN